MDCGDNDTLAHKRCREGSSAGRTAERRPSPRARGPLPGTRPSPPFGDTVPVGADRSDAVIFDLDGVLIDSRDAIARCINDALTRHGMPARPAASLHRFIGPPLAVAFSELTGEPIDAALTIACVDSYRATYESTSAADTTVVPGVEDALADLAGDHCLAVATSKAHALAVPLLVALGLHGLFDVIAGPGLDDHTENKAATIGRAMTELGVGEAVMVGDRSFDVVGAQACSIPVIGVSWGIGTVEELRSAGADLVIDAPSDLRAALGRLPGRSGG
jgi:phosphoglycolate phosphatase